MSEPYVHALFPDGSFVSIRVENFGVVFDPQTEQPIDAELAVDVLLIKARKLAAVEHVGRA